MNQRKTFPLSTRLPVGMKEFFHKYAKKTPHQYASQLLNHYLQDYLNYPQKYPLTKEDVLKYENLAKDKKDFSFQANKNIKEQLELEVTANLTSGRNFTLKFIYSIYNYLINNNKKEE